MTRIEEGHILKRFDNELTHLHDLVMQMGALVQEQIQRTLRALDDENPEAAREVITRDRLVNELDIQVDDELVRLLAKRQPMATDLREVMTIAKSVTDLERVGDEIRKVAHLVERLYDNGNPVPNQRLLGDIPYLADFASHMLQDALESFDTLDTGRAIAVIRRDRELEVEFQDALRRLATYIMQDARNVGHAVDAVLALRALERIGGHAKNIAGYVIYLCTGRDVRHEDVDSIEETLVRKP